MTPEQQQRAQEALQRAMQHSNMLSPEQMQAIQNAMSHLQQGGAGGSSYTVVQSPDGRVIQQPGAVGPQTGWPQQSDPQSGWPQPGQPQADPYTQRQFEFAAADLKRWLAQYAQYRGQGQFATLEAVFEVAQRIPG
jgi:PAS domain-containing protein